MTPKKNKKLPKFISVKLSQKQAEILGIVKCSCGHRKNNHFSTMGTECAKEGCACGAYDQVVCLPSEPTNDE